MLLPPISTLGANASPVPRTANSIQDSSLAYLSMIATRQMDNGAQSEAFDSAAGSSNDRQVSPGECSLRSPDQIHTAASTPSASQNSESNTKKSKRKRARVITDERRQQCRKNQARYRRKQMKHAKELEAVVESLRLEVPALEIQHIQLVSSSRLTAWYVAIEYFRLFRHGMRPSQQPPSQATDSTLISEEQHQLAFLRSTVATNVVVGGQQGVTVLIQEWRRYSTYFDDLLLQLKHVSQASQTVFTASATLSVTISETTIQQVFPHLAAASEQERDSGEGTPALLRSRLLGQRLALPCRLCFEWDEEIKQVVQVDTAVDFFTPIFRVVRTLKNAAFVLEKALINMDSSIGELKRK